MFLFYTTRKHQKSSGNVCRKWAKTLYSSHGGVQFSLACLYLKFMQTVLYKNNVSSYLVGFPALGEPIILLEAVIFFLSFFFGLIFIY